MSEYARIVRDPGQQATYRVEGGRNRQRWPTQPEPPVSAETLARRAAEAAEWEARHREDQRVKRIHGAAYGRTLHHRCKTCDATYNRPCVAAGGGERSTPHGTRVQSVEEWMNDKQARGILGLYHPAPFTVDLRDAA